MIKFNLIPLRNKRGVFMNKRNVIENLKQFDLFADLSEKKLQSLTEFVYWRTYKKGQFLFLEGDSRERIYLMLDGFIKL